MNNRKQQLLNEIIKQIKHDMPHVFEKLKGMKMISGNITKIEEVHDRINITVNLEDGTDYPMKLVKSDDAFAVKVGDFVWWDSQHIYWQSPDGRKDVPLERHGRREQDW